MNKIEKLELRHLCGYLPHGLKFVSELDKPYDEFGCNPIWTAIGITFLFGEYCLTTKENNDAYPIRLCKLLLLPLSALTEPMEDGSVPIVELAKIAGFEDFEVLQVKEGSTAYIATLSDNFKFMVLKSNCDFAICEGKEITFLPSQLQLFEYLYSIHADIYGLIPAGLAIDKRTVKN